MHKGILGVALAAVLTFAGCSNSADPEEVDALAESLTSDADQLNVEQSTSQAECLARLYLESDLSEEALAAIREGEPPAPKTDEDIEVLRELADKIAEECLSPET